MNERTKIRTKQYNLITKKIVDQSFMLFMSCIYNTYKFLIYNLQYFIFFFLFSVFFKIHN